MNRAFRFLWQMPQNLIGFIMSRFCCRWVTAKTLCGKYIKIYYMKNLFRSGISLGDFILLDIIYETLQPESLITTVSHEYGHGIQSKILGPLYFLVIGIPSILGNLYAKCMRKDSKWYYSQLWEKWADKLGNVKR